MPLFFTNKDITSLKVDAVVNAANKSLLGGMGVDGAIHSAAGPQLLNECRSLGGCETGEAKITAGYNLHAKYIIHTVGPVWKGGKCGEAVFLRRCYENSLKLAAENHIESIAFPIISAGAYGYPKAEALKCAVTTVRDFLIHSDMTVYIDIFDPQCLALDGSTLCRLKSYISENYKEKSSLLLNLYNSFTERQNPKPKEKALPVKDFKETLRRHIALSGLSDIELSNRSNTRSEVLTQLFEGHDFGRRKSVLISLIFALELTHSEAEILLASIGKSFLPEKKEDLAAEYFLKNRIFDIDLINLYLFSMGLPQFGI